MHPLRTPLPSGEVASGAAGEGGSSTNREGELARPRTAQSFCVPKSDIAAAGYDLSLNRYKEVVHEEVQHDPPKKILAELRKIEEEIEKGMKELEGMLG
jgi:type I restriction enzyme M protein